MPVTMSRMNIIKGLGPVLQIAEGYTIDFREEVHRTLTERTNPTWPTTWFVPRLTGEGNFKDVYSVMANWGANHGAFTYGHIGAQLMTLASMLRIPVCMHNVPEEKIFRPSSWSAFGMDTGGIGLQGLCSLRTTCISKGLIQVSNREIRTPPFTHTCILLSILIHAVLLHLVSG